MGIGSGSSRLMRHSTALGSPMDMEVGFSSGVVIMAGSGSIFSLGSGFKSVVGMGSGM